MQSSQYKHGGEWLGKQSVLNQNQLLCISLLLFVRARIMFLETKESCALIQAWWRGVQVRSKLPQYRKEKQERDVSTHNDYNTIVKVFRLKLA